MGVVEGGGTVLRRTARRPRRPPPDGVEAPPGKVAHLLKALYGPKQSGRSWYGELTDIPVEQLHFDRAVSDACLFIITVKFDNGEFIRR